MAQYPPGATPHEELSSVSKKPITVMTRARAQARARAKAMVMVMVIVRERDAETHFQPKRRGERANTIFF